MIVESLLGLSLVLNVSLSRSENPNEPPGWPRDAASMSVRQKEAALLPLVRRATDCIVREVGHRMTSDARLPDDIEPGTVDDLIADSIAACAQPVHAMIDAHDRMYGDGSGEAFLLGPYLDVLPSALVQQVKIRTR